MSNSSSTSSSQEVEPDEDFGHDLEDGRVTSKMGLHESDDTADNSELDNRECLNENHSVPSDLGSLTTQDFRATQESARNGKSNRSMASFTPTQGEGHVSKHVTDGSDENSKVIHGPLLPSNGENKDDTIPTQGQALIAMIDTHKRNDGVVSSSNAFDSPAQASHRRSRRRRWRRTHRRMRGALSRTDNHITAHVAKDLLSALLFVLAIILASLTVALDPVGEGNWFRRIEEGVFVLFTISIPGILAGRLRVTETLELLMPEQVREVKTIKDLRKQRGDIEDEEFWRELQKAILVDADIPKLFRFENPCYKITRNDGRLIVPNAAKYKRVPRRVWKFGREVCFNAKTGEAFKYILSLCERLRLIHPQCGATTYLVVKLLPR